MHRFKLLFLILISGAAIAQDRFAKVEIKAQHVSESVHMLVGAGGNIGVSAGDDGLVIIDDQFAPLAEKIAAALAEINPSPVKYVVNTHYHGDHTGGNAWLKELQGATVLAHENVRVRLAGKDDHNPASLPVVTYQHGVKIHFNGETIHVVHLPSGHTDSDSAVLFEKANVLHTGDLFFKDRFPYVDIKGGGSVAGYIASVQVLLNKIDEQSKVIPGHGSLSNKQELQAFLDMMVATSNAVGKMKKSGRTLEEIVATGLDKKWASWGTGWINEERWITTLYQ